MGLYLLCLGATFLTFGGRDSYVWGFVFLLSWVSNSYVWVLVFSRLGVNFLPFRGYVSYVLGLGILILEVCFLTLVG